MKNKILFVVLLILGATIQAQEKLGVGTKTPATNLQVVGAPAMATSADGITIPTLTGDQLAAKNAEYVADETATMVYVTAAATTPAGKTINVTAAGFYYFDGTIWQQLTNTNSQTNIYDDNGTIGTGRTLGVTDNVNFDSNTLVIDGTNDRVGIGTSTPSNKLVLNEDNSTGATFQFRNYENTVDNYRQILFTGYRDVNQNHPLVALRAIATSSESTLSRDGDLAFFTEQGAGGQYGVEGTTFTEKMRITSEGNVIINGQVLGGAQYGDLKQGVQTGDHSGWILLDGRDKSTLTDAQRARFETLFGATTTNLPQTSGNGQETATYIADIDGDASTVGGIAGNTDNLWSSGDLPNLTHNHSGTTSNNGSHSHRIQRNTNGDGAGSNFLRVGGTGGGDTGPGAPILNNGAHTHTVTVGNVNPGGSNALVSTTNRTLDANTFIYLGQ